MTLKLEVGKSYLTTNHGKVRVVAERFCPSGTAKFIGLSLRGDFEVPLYYFEDGRQTMSPLDNLVSEYKEPMYMYFNVYSTATGNLHEDKKNVEKMPRYSDTPSDRIVST